MDRVEQIEADIANLPPNEYLRLVEWFRLREQAGWDEQMNRDSAAGRLDVLFQAADNDAASALVRPWPCSV